MRWNGSGNEVFGTMRKGRESVEEETGVVKSCFQRIYIVEEEDSVSVGIEEALKLVEMIGRGEVPLIVSSWIDSGASLTGWMICSATVDSVRNERRHTGGRHIYRVLRPFMDPRCISGRRSIATIVKELLELSFG